MDRMTRRRFVAIFLIVAIMCGIFAFRLFKLQVTEDVATGGSKTRTLSYSTVVEASRGKILDRNGKVLVDNRAGYDLSIANLAFFSGDSPARQILTLIRLCDKNGETVIDTLPISMEKPYTYTENPTTTQKNHLSAYLKWRQWDPEMSARNLLARMKETYRIPEEWDDDTVRRVLGVRYELDLRYCVGLDNYVLARDISTDTLAAALELGIPGVSADPTTVRVYHTDYAAHILGRVGPIFAEEVDHYKELGYSMDAQVGKDGMELAFEEYLRGTNGKKTTVITADGQVLETYYEQEPQPGSNVSLSIDIELQAVAEEKLEDVILDLRQNGVGTKKEGKDAVGGAVVAVEVKTGELLASASYPTFDITTYNQHFNELLEAEGDPLKNRALTEAYNPGSIFKMVTGIAAIDEDNASRWRNITDQGVYTYYKDQGYTCNCHIWTSSRVTHGTINMMEAISVSCNYYFYEVGREAGIDAIAKVAKELGLGEKTGVEIYEATGTRASRETRKDLYAGTDSANWYGADTLQASIGQSDNSFTPVQLAAYCATLARGGLRLRSTFLHEVTSWDSSQLLYRTVPEETGGYPMSENALAAVKEGMELAASTGTAATHFKNYPIPVAGKTGTAQHGTGGSDNASFICYAPADDPQIAIAIYVEKGAQGGNLGQIARAMMDVYFAGTTEMPSVTPENTVS